MISIGKKWHDGAFQKLSALSKLVYVYLVSHPSLTTVGTVSLVPDIAANVLNMSLDDFRSSTQELVDNKYIYVKSYEGLIYFIVPAHFSSQSTNDGTIERMKSALASLPSDLKEYLSDIGITAGKKYKKFHKPTPAEVEKVGMEFGYKIDGEEFCKYYEDISRKQGKFNLWVDSRGTQIKDWKMKMKRIWCKPTNQLKKNDKAPQGFEYFFVEIDGRLYFPTTWKDGLPKSDDFTVNRELLKKFKNK